MKLLHVVPTYLPAIRYGGPIVAIHGLAAALAARGHEVDVFTTNVDGKGTLDVPLRKPVRIDGVDVTYYPSEFPRIYRSRGMAAAMEKTIGTYDLVHSHAVYLWPGVAAARAARHADVPYVIAPRGMLVPELIRQKNRVVKTLWLQMVERPALAHAAAIHFTSRLEWDDAVRTRLPLPSPFVVPNGIELLPRPSVARDERTLLFLGRISWKKGIERVIQALPHLPDVRFVVAGNDDEALTPRLRELARRLNVEQRVEFVGPVYGAIKQELLARATLFVLMSQSENFGNTVLESLAMETPVVLSRGVGLAEEVVAHGAGVIGLEAAPALLADGGLRAEMGQKGRALVESRFTWPSVAEQMEEAYRRCCSTTSRR